MPNPGVSKITDHLYLGDGKSSWDRKILGEHNITAVVSLSEGRWVHWDQPWYKEIIVEGNHLFRQCEDSLTQDLLPWLADICDFIKQHLKSGSVLVHCNQGVSRSATIMIAYLMSTDEVDFGGRYDLATAEAFVKERRRIRPNKNFREQLEVWGAVRGNIWEAPGVPKPEYAVYLANRSKRLQEAGLTGNEPVGIISL